MGSSKGTRGKGGPGVIVLPSLESMADTNEFIARLLGRAEGITGESSSVDGVYEELKELAAEV